MIRLENIDKSYGNLSVLKSVNAQFGEGEVVSIVGASGAGKSTLLQIAGLLDRPDGGRVWYDDVDAFSLSGRRLAEWRNRRVGFVFQFHQLLPEFTAIENVMIPALFAGKKKSQARARAVELLDFLGLSERMKHKPEQMSGGERQRVAVARALVNSPSVIFADEPSGSLDSKNKAELHQLFFDLRREFNQTFVIVTHDEGLASMCDRTLKMRDGVIYAEEKNRKESADQVVADGEQSL